jgi:hypothetical protein
MRWTHVLWGCATHSALFKRQTVAHQILSDCCLIRAKVNHTKAAHHPFVYVD